MAIVVQTCHVTEYLFFCHLNVCVLNILFILFLFYTLEIPIRFTLNINFIDKSGNNVLCLLLLLLSLTHLILFTLICNLFLYLSLLHVAILST